MLTLYSSEGRVGMVRSFVNLKQYLLKMPIYFYSLFFQLASDKQATYNTPYLRSAHFFPPIVMIHTDTAKPTIIPAILATSTDFSALVQRVRNLRMPMTTVIHSRMSKLF